ATQADAHSLMYAGCVFGYFRSPTEQDDAMQSCSAITERRSDLVESFLNEMKTLDTPGATIRVAVGDNFAPFLLARQMWSPAVQPLQPTSKALLGYDTDPQVLRWVRQDQLSPAANQAIRSGRGTIPFDNVACFLRLAKFN